MFCLEHKLFRLLRNTLKKKASKKGSHCRPQSENFRFLAVSRSLFSALSHGHRMWQKMRMSDCTWIFLISSYPLTKNKLLTCFLANKRAKENFLLLDLCVSSLRLRIIWHRWRFMWSAHYRDLMHRQLLMSDPVSYVLLLSRYECDYGKWCMTVPCTISSH